MRNKAVLILILLQLVFLDASFSIPDEGKDTLLEKLDILVRVQKLLQTGKIYNFNTISCLFFHQNCKERWLVISIMLFHNFRLK